MLVKYDYLLPDPESKFSLTLTIDVDAKKIFLCTREDPYILMYLQIELLATGYTSYDGIHFKRDPKQGYELTCDYNSRKDFINCSPSWFKDVEGIVEDVFNKHRWTMIHREKLDKILLESGLIINREFTGSGYIKTKIRALDDTISQSIIMIEHASAGYSFTSLWDELMDLYLKLKKYRGQAKRLETDFMLGQIYSAQRKIKDYLIHVGIVCPDRILKF